MRRQRGFQEGSFLHKFLLRTKILSFASLSFFLSLSLSFKLVFPFVKNMHACRRRIVRVVRKCQPWIWNSPSPMAVNRVKIGIDRVSIPLDEIWSLRKQLGQGFPYWKQVSCRIWNYFVVNIDCVHSFIENFFDEKWWSINHTFHPIMIILFAWRVFSFLRITSDGMKLMKFIRIFRRDDFFFFNSWWTKKNCFFFLKLLWSIGEISILQW